MADLSALASAVLHQLKDAAERHGQQQSLTVTELTGLLAIERPVLDGALAELDEAGLVRVRGATNTSASSIQLTDDAVQCRSNQSPATSP